MPYVVRHGTEDADRVLTARLTAGEACGANASRSRPPDTHNSVVSAPQNPRAEARYARHSAYDITSRARAGLIDLSVQSRLLYSLIPE